MWPLFASRDVDTIAASDSNPGSRRRYARGRFDADAGGLRRDQVGDPANSTRQTLDRPIDSLDAQHILYLQNDMKGGCSGDSGGPALTRVGGAERVAGVFSYTVDLPSINLFCSLQSASVRVSSLASFIHSIAGGGSPPDAGGPMRDCSRTVRRRQMQRPVTGTPRTRAAATQRTGSIPPPPTARARAATARDQNRRQRRTQEALSSTPRRHRTRGPTAAPTGKENAAKRVSGCSCVVSGRSGSTSTWGWLSALPRSCGLDASRDKTDATSSFSVTPHATAGDG